jgi:hypothetical protein
MMERADDLGLSLSLSSSLAPRTHHVATLLHSPGKYKLYITGYYYTPATVSTTDHAFYLSHAESS